MLILSAGIENAVPLFLAIVFAFAYHEFAHAIVADRLGDPTPRSYGRMTLNPIPHLSLIGLLMVVLFGFGWASTPVTPGYLRGNIRRSHALVAAAGPFANLIMALIWAGIAWGMGLIGPEPFSRLPSFLASLIVALPQWGILMNFFLMFFNLIPVPPLDGFTILVGILPYDLAMQLEPLRRYGMMILIVAILLLPSMGFNPFNALFDISITLYRFLASSDYSLLTVFFG